MLDGPRVCLVGEGGCGIGRLPLRGSPGGGGGLGRLELLTDVPSLGHARLHSFCSLTLSPERFASKGRGLLCGERRLRRLSERLHLRRHRG